MSLRRFWSVALFVSLVGVDPSARAQGADPEESQRDIVTHATTTFKVRVNQVLMRVVVTDSHGSAVGNLTKDNFQILDNGKLRTIASFSATAGSGNPTPAAAAQSGGSKDDPTREVAEPHRYVAYLFDDLHLKDQDMPPLRNAARQHLLSSLKATDRAAIFTTSGKVSLDFTSDGTAVVEALDRIQPEKRTETNPCPWISYYTADLIVNKQDQEALRTIKSDAINCVPLRAPTPEALEAMAQALALQKAQQELVKGDAETKMAFSVLRDVISDLSGRAGQRSLVFVSPGFLAKEEHYIDLSEALDKALRAKIVVNAFDARGLYVDPQFEASNNRGDSHILQYMHDGARDDGDVLGELADGTGGVWFHDNNDLQEGFRRTATTPEYVYLIAFTPQNLKYDGKFHTLKVIVKGGESLTARTRKGYFAPKAAESAAEQAQSDIEDAVFSRDERQEIPVDLHTEFFRAHDKANVAVVTRVDLRMLQFRKDAGRNLNTLTVVSALFDRNGRYIAGLEKKIEFHMRDEMLQRQLRKGIAVKSSFAVDPGDYMVRVVVRDAEGEMMSTKNDTVNIPYN